VYTYLLRMAPFLADCLGDEVTTGEVHYQLRWRVESAVGHFDGFDYNDLVGKPDGWTDDQVVLFERCVTAYAAEHTVALPNTPLPATAWATGMSFPIGSGSVYQIIATTE
jgi:hypothetical protein